MSNGAATEKALGSLHSGLANVFTMVLKKYKLELDLLSSLSEEATGDLDEDMKTAMMLLASKEPNPAMLGAISKFLKDNEIAMDSEEIDKLSDTDRRLADMAKQRKNLSISDIPVVVN